MFKTHDHNCIHFRQTVNEIQDFSEITAINSVERLVSSGRHVKQVCFFYVNDVNNRHHLISIGK